MLLDKRRWAGLLTRWFWSGSNPSSAHNSSLSLLCAPTITVVCGVISDMNKSCHRCSSWSICGASKPLIESGVSPLLRGTSVQIAAVSWSGSARSDCLTAAYAASLFRPAKATVTAQTVYALLSLGGQILIVIFWRDLWLDFYTSFGVDSWDLLEWVGLVDLGRMNVLSSDFGASGRNVTV